MRRIPVKRLTFRGRLTLLYGGLVFLTGIVLLGVTYLLVDQRSQAQVGGLHPVVESSPPATPPTHLAGSPDDLKPISINGRVISIDDLPDYLRTAALKTLLTQGGIALVAVTAIAVAFAWLLAGRALQPIHRITETARRVAGGNLGERIALDGPHDEVKELADTFDSMLVRLDQAFDGQRRFVANASHELRTPLAINRALAELAITRPGASADCVQLGDALLTVNTRHERLIDGLLTLADSENEVTHRSPVDLADMASHVLAEAARPAADASVTIRSSSLTPAPTTGDPVLLERLTQNLVENAIRHNTPGGWVSVSVEELSAEAVLTVRNSGPVVPKYEVETLFQPFRRLANERSAGPDRGFGLGLSIVRAVARAHGGAVDATPRTAGEGGGLVVTVRLPIGHPEQADPRRPVLKTR